LKLAATVAELAADGRAVVVATHDVEFAAEVADRAMVMAEGEVIADGPAGEVIGGSPAFAPQTAKVLAPLAYLTVGQVERALAGGAA
ncbi:MAG TPA: cobalt ABC transporter ATP-binding protein, partial [Acidimicrobiales bacterium]|nr:cobalt ABC transporter ATP-binding protein [Acidimicrobiales bacterium]